MIPSFLVFARVVKKKTGLMPTQVNPDFNPNDWVFDGQTEVQAIESAEQFLREEGHDNSESLPLVRQAMQSLVS